MNDTRTIPLTTVALYVLWSIVAVCIVTSWVLMFTGSRNIAILFGFTGCCFVGAAATVMIRSYMFRICGLIRSLHGIDAAPQGGDLHRVH